MSLDVHGRRPPSDKRPRQPRPPAEPDIIHATSQDPPPPGVEPQQIDNSVMTIRESPASPPPVESSTEVITPIHIPLCRIPTAEEDAGQGPSDPILRQWLIHPIDVDLDRIVKEPPQLTWQQQVQQLPPPDLGPRPSLGIGPIAANLSQPSPSDPAVRCPRQYQATLPRPTTPSRSPDHGRCSKGS